VSHPGEVFKGQISFIDPYLDSATRTVKVRVNVPNHAGKLKPGMFVRASVRARVAAGGRVMDPKLAGKWICPMHPDVIKDVLGKCDLCKMPLVRAESLGYLAVSEEKSSKPLVIPATAPLVTGERAIVYVELPDKDRPTFEGREIVLGPRAGDFYIVRHGLKEGERVVTQGNFKIDSALQIQAKPSMMTPEGGGVEGLHEHHAAMGSASKSPTPTEKHTAVPEHFISRLEELQRACGKLREVVRRGGLEESRAAFKTFGDSLKSMDTFGLEGRAAAAWRESAMLLGNDAILGGDAEDAEMLSRHFADFEKHWSTLAMRFQIPPPKPKPKTDPEAAKKTQRFREQLGGVYTAYLGIQSALAGDDAAGARSAVAKAQQALQRVDMKLLSGKNHAAWMQHQAALGGALKQMAEADGIQGMREGFALLSEDLSQALPAFGFQGRSAYLLRCPMAFNNRGAVWLQTDKDVRNPYFGSRMFKCGTVLRSIARGRRQSKGDRRHE
jgi:Cu(I)/Ag(I) efflux system membrane fusion protein